MTASRSFAFADLLAEPGPLRRQTDRHRLAVKAVDEIRRTLAARECALWPVSKLGENVAVARFR
jgi:hypothetical protein